MSRISVVAVVAVAGVLFCVAPGQAASGTAGTCQAELEKFCAGVQTGEGRVLKCLEEHDADLSAACRAHVNTMAQYQACLDDAVRLCPGIQPGVGKGLKCLRSHMTDLSTDCKRELQKIKP